ncbi:MAG: Uma2 family endonuclease, partial [Ferruginibacter sp.]|nr:Uma2 family endonuclease [Cytophagales bacterium]
MVNWNRKAKLGLCFDSSAGFTLLNRAVRSPDAAWIAKARWEEIPATDRKKFAHLCPDFIVELMSENDTLHESRSKMQEWM